jgi:hypothetical protein
VVEHYKKKRKRRKMEERKCFPGVREPAQKLARI